MDTKKSLNESINEVLSSKMSKADKKAAIIKLGVRDNEARLVMKIWDDEHPVERRPRATYTFGVEIECYVNYSNVRSNTIQFQHQSYNHCDSREVFKFVHDGSVCGAIDGQNGIECVTPVLDSCKKGYDALKECCKALNEQNAKVNKKCGLHVHIGADNLSDEAYANAVANYMYCEKVIDTFMANSRRANNASYARSIIGLGLENARTRKEAQMCFTHGRTPNQTMWRSSFRYYKVNTMSWFGHKTLEFRQHAGTTDYTKISNWVKFLVKLVDWSKTNRLTAAVNSIDDIPFITKTEKAWFKARANALA